MITCLLSVNVAIANCLYGDCVNGLGIQTIKKPLFYRIAIGVRDPSYNKEIYVGDFDDGKKTGCATIRDDRSIYFGQVLDSKKNGLGTFLDIKSGKIKEGRWKNNRFKEAMAVEIEGLCL